LVLGMTAKQIQSVPVPNYYSVLKKIFLASYFLIEYGYSKF
jgi:hypothetical protein